MVRLVQRPTWVPPLLLARSSMTTGRARRASQGLAHTAVFTDRGLPLDLDKVLEHYLALSVIQNGSSEITSQVV